MAIYVLFLILNIIILSIIVIQAGTTALMEASGFGRLSVVQYLVQQGAAIEIQNNVRNHNINFCLLLYYIIVW